jgi:hypothetical protein
LRYGDVDAEEGEFRRTFSQQCWEIDHLDGRDERSKFNLEGDPSGATPIDACYEHLATTSATLFKDRVQVLYFNPVPKSLCLGQAAAETQTVSG